MDCAIRIVKGPEQGRQFQCHAAESVVGRSPRCVVRLSSSSVSFEHAIIARTGDDFFIENLSAAGTFVNDERISGKVRLRTRDQLRFGAETVARVDALPAGRAKAGKKRGLLFGVIGLLLALIIFAVANPFASPPTVINSRTAYARLEVWTQDEVDHRDMPVESIALLRQAWRLQAAGDKAHARPLWLRLEVLLAQEEPRLGFQAAASQKPGALAHVARSETAVSQVPDEEMGAALVQFVTQVQKMP